MLTQGISLYPSLAIVNNEGKEMRIRAGIFIIYRRVDHTISIGSGDENTWYWQHKYSGIQDDRFSLGEISRLAVEAMVSIVAATHKLSYSIEESDSYLCFTFKEREES